MIGDIEIGEWANRFGVQPEQVRRDHLISHVLSALSTVSTEVVFFGGTALARTHLDGGRLSEDIDLLADDHRELEQQLEGSVPGLLRSEFPGLIWRQVRANSRIITAVLEGSDVQPVKIELVRVEPHERRGEYEERPVGLRYPDLPATVTFLVPTLATFAAMKLSAWADRRTPRDLFDLAGLAAVGGIDSSAVEVHRRMMERRPALIDFAAVPAAAGAAWDVELAHQTGSLPGPEDCLAAVRDSLTAAL